MADNVAAIPRLLGWPESRTRERVDELLTRVGLPASAYRERRPAELSGGQQQPVGVARALAAEARVLLMDEPIGAVDPVTRDGLQQELGSMRDQLGLTIVLVTHDVTEALLLADLVAALSPLIENIDDSTMREANRRVDLNHHPVAEVARDLSAQLPN